MFIFGHHNIRISFEKSASFNGGITIGLLLSDAHFWCLICFLGLCRVMIEISLQNHLWYFGFQIDLGGVTTLRLGFAWIKNISRKRTIGFMQFCCWLLSFSVWPCIYITRCNIMYAEPKPINRFFPKILWSALSQTLMIWGRKFDMDIFVELGTKKYINPLRAKFFRGNIKHIFTFYVITPRWYDTGT